MFRRTSLCQMPQSDCTADCTNVYRDRQIKIKESYLQQLAIENERLRGQLSQSPGFPPTEDTVMCQVPAATDADMHVWNPMLREDAWFQHYDPSTPPIYIGDAACTAFAARLRQVLTKSKKISHMPRTQYTPEVTLMEIPNPAMQWPSLTQARLLIQTVLNQVNRVYHLVFRKTTIEDLEQMYRKRNFDDPILTCKFFALFALGEVYSSRSNSNLECGVPGAAYYVNAMTLIPILPERPNLTHIESLLLLSLYSYFLNRRHSAFLLVGSAMRLGLILGLNYMGWPIQIADDDIHPEMPSNVAGDAQEEQFSDTQFLIVSIQLARITGQVTEKVYSRKPQPNSFLQREQQLLITLKQWLQVLPPHIQFKCGSPLPKHVTSLHLQFNQCIILATRPILLYALIQSRNSSPADTNSTQSKDQIIRTLGDACVHAARHTHSMIMEEWINGSLPIFGCFYADYLFSCALIMVVSSQLHDNRSDFALFEMASEILHAMSGHGNLAATEFYDNLEGVRQFLDKDSTGKTVLGATSRIFDQTPLEAPLSVGISDHYPLARNHGPG
ncbi:hypothetical protein N7485_000007 [Penicillium canescens]|nr:hypothetical protein N7485_000007 [Penicillium canescens]